MKFKNYRNKYSDDDRIYSSEDVYNMPVGEAFNRKEELLSQNRQIGMPTPDELRSSGNVVWVSAYKRDDGTEVCAHWRSKPDSATENNLAGGIGEKDSVILRENQKFTSKVVQYAINFNNDRNAMYKDARDCMNIALLGPENIQDTEEYKVILDADVESISKMLKFDIPNDYKTISYSSDSSMAKALNESKELKKQLQNWLKHSYGKEKERLQISINEDTNLFRSIHNAVVLNLKYEKGYVTGYLYDLYDFNYQDYSDFKDGRLWLYNTGAYILQESQILKNYNILVPIKVKI